MAAPFRVPPPAAPAAPGDPKGPLVRDVPSPVDPRLNEGRTDVIPERGPEEAWPAVPAPAQMPMRLA